MRVIIDSQVRAKIQAWVDNCKIECSGLGKVVRQANGDFVVVDAILLKQECTSVHTTLDAAAIGKAMFELKDSDGDLNWWWHSHVDMACQWSGTDHATMDSFTDKGYCLATVFNKRGDTRSAYTQKGHDLLPNIFMDDLRTVSKYFTTKEQTDAWKKELDEKVTEEVAPMYGGYGNFSGDNYYREWCDTSNAWVWPWELPAVATMYMTHKEFVAYYKFDPLAGTAKSVNKAKKAIDMAKQKKGADLLPKKGKAQTVVGGIRVSVPVEYKKSTVIPAKKLQKVFDSFRAYFKHTPKLQELESYFFENLGEF